MAKDLSSACFLKTGKLCRNTQWTRKTGTHKRTAILRNNLSMAVLSLYFTLFYFALANLHRKLILSKWPGQQQNSKNSLSNLAQQLRTFDNSIQTAKAKGMELAGNPLIDFRPCLFWGMKLTFVPARGADFLSKTNQEVGANWWHALCMPT